MTTNRSVNKSRYSWILLTTVATLLCFPAIGSADDIVDKKAAVDKKIEAKKAADAKKKASVKEDVDKKSGNKAVKPAKVDKQKGDEVKKPVKVDKPKGDKVIKSTKGDKKIAADKRAPITKKDVNVKSGKKSVASKKIDKSKMPQKRYATINVPKSIKLTPEQSEKVAALDKEFAPKLKGLTEKRNAIITPEQRKAGREALNAAKDAGKTGRELKDAYAAVVRYTDEQKQQFQDIQTDLKELHKTIQGKFNELLTDEQKSQIKHANSKGSQKTQKKKVQPAKTK